MVPCAFWICKVPPLPVSLDWAMLSCGVRFRLLCFPFFRSGEANTSASRSDLQLDSFLFLLPSEALSPGFAEGGGHEHGIRIHFWAGGGRFPPARQEISQGFQCHRGKQVLLPRELSRVMEREEGSAAPVVAKCQVYGRLSGHSDTAGQRPPGGARTWPLGRWHISRWFERRAGPPCPELKPGRRVDRQELDGVWPQLTEV